MLSNKSRKPSPYFQILSLEWLYTSSLWHQTIQPTYSKGKGKLAFQGLACEWINNTTAEGLEHPISQTFKFYCPLLSTAIKHQRKTHHLCIPSNKTQLCLLSWTRWAQISTVSKLNEKPIINCLTGSEHMRRWMRMISPLRTQRTRQSHLLRRFKPLFKHSPNSRLHFCIFR